MSPQAVFIFVAGSVVPSLMIALLATYFVRLYAASWGLLDQPGDRKVHTTPTPRGGGLAIWLGVIGTFAVGMLGLWLAERVPAINALVPDFAEPHLAGIWSQIGKLWLLLAAGSVLMLLGLMDDRGGLSWQLRLLVEFGVAAVCVWMIDDLRLSAFIDMPILMGAVRVWIVADPLLTCSTTGRPLGGVADCGQYLAAVLLMADPTNKPQLFVAGLLSSSLADWRASLQPAARQNLHG
jgi:UDP-GlcNAc:undecaprenyl-phosphate GlcNAc-1-phosphate transferase